MTALEITLISYLGLVLLGAIIQAYIEMGRRPDIQDFFLATFILIPLFFLYNLFAAPFVAIINSFKIFRNPEPDTFNIIYFNENEIDQQLFALGFRDFEHRVSVDNIPYNGYTLPRKRSLWRNNIIIAEDFEISEKDPEMKRKFLRVSVYSKDSDTKYIVEQLKNIDEHYKRMVKEKAEEATI